MELLFALALLFLVSPFVLLALYAATRQELRRLRTTVNGLIRDLSDVHELRDRVAHLEAGRGAADAESAAPVVAPAAQISEVTPGSEAPPVSEVPPVSEALPAPPAPPAPTAPPVSKVPPRMEPTKPRPSRPASPVRPKPHAPVERPARPAPAGRRSG